MNDPTIEEFDDPTLGFRSNLDGTFAEAEARMKRRVAEATSASSSPHVDRHSPERANGELPSYVPVQRHRRRHRTRTVVLSSAGLLLLALTIGFVWSASRGPGPDLPSIDQIAQAAADTPAAPFSDDRPAEFELVTIEQRGSSTVSRRSRTTINADGTGQIQADAEELVSGDAGTELEPASMVAVTSDPVVAGFVYIDLLNLPPEPRVLVAAIEAVTGTGDRAAVAEVLAWVGSARSASPQLRAAAVTTLGELSTDEQVSTTDLLGRPGVGLEGDAWSVVVDATDGSVLAFRSDAPDGTDGSTWTLWNP